LPWIAAAERPGYLPSIVSSPGQFAPLEVALANGRRLLATQPEAAAEQAREILVKDEQNREALRLLASALRRLGQVSEAAEAETEAIKAASNEPALVQAAQAIQSSDLKRAEHFVRPYLDRHPDDPAAFRLLAEIAARVGLPAEATNYLRKAIELAPAYASAHVKLANLLYQQGNYRGSIEQLDQLLALDPDQGSARMSKAAGLVMVGDFREAARIYEQLIEKQPDNATMWISYAHVLNTLGQFEEAVAAYRHSIQLRPSQGDAWWSLANLKVARFSDDDIAAMLATLEEPELDDKARTQIHFALGKAFEDSGNYERAFDHYAAGNRIRAAEQTYDPASKDDLVARSQAVLTRDYFRDRAGAGAESADPIFVLGLPRAGSTLVEQILSSHSKIEGTAELPYIPALRQQIGFKTGEPFPASIAAIPPADLAALGERYLANARAHRKTARPLFIDKLPNNWECLGLILTILPNARIVDARRHPMACGFSNFKQLYARGQEFSYSLDWMGRYYADYVRMMRHFDELLPGRVHRVIHEQLIDNPEEEIRALLDYIGVPFEESCLRFYENERPVRTPSAGQVRQPLNRKGVDQWRNFEPWLGDLKQALGPVLTAYPDVPARSELR
jgi:tetratricopeptide (TPR) repeat protein